MTFVRTLLAALSKSAAADQTLMRVRVRVSMDTLATFAVTVLAVGMAVGYQVLGRLGRDGRSDPGGAR